MVLGMKPCTMTPIAALVWNAARQWPLAMLVALVLVTFVVWMYRPQLNRLTSIWRWTLPVLRSLALLALALSIIKPVMVRPASRSEWGGILILVDRSRSMSVMDMAHFPRSDQDRAHPEAGPNPTPRAAGEMVALADGLGRLRPGLRRVDLSKLRDDTEHLRQLFIDLVRSRGEMDFAKLSGQGVEPARARINQITEQIHTAARALETALIAAGQKQSLVTTLHPLAQDDADKIVEQGAAILQSVSARLATAQGNADLLLYLHDSDVRAACDELAGMSRLDRAEAALCDPGAGLLGPWPVDVPLYGFSFADDIAQLPLRGARQPVRRLLLEANGTGSDITGAIRAAIDRAGGAPLQGVIVLTDGQQVGGDGTVPAAMAASGIPIYPVNCGVEGTIPDVSIASASMPARCFVGETITSRVDLHTSEPPGRSIVVTTDIDDQTAATRPVALNEATTMQQIPIRFDQPGVHRVAFTIPWQPDEPTPDNKRVIRYVTVLSDKVGVGLFTGPVTWDYEYVRNALARTPWVKLTDAIIPDDWNAARPGSGDLPAPPGTQAAAAAPAAVSPPATQPAARLPLTPAQILDLDLLVLFDLRTSALSDEQWDAVYRLVTERGGSVLLVAGDAHLPDEWVAHAVGGGLLPFPPTEKAVWRVWPGKEAGFHLAVAPGAQNVDALKMDDTNRQPTQQWSALPPFFRYLALPKLRPNARALLVEQDSSSPVLVESRLGLGRCFFFSATETWRWRAKVGEKIQDRFWMQLMRYAADEPYAVHEKRMSLDASLAAAQPGQPLSIRAKLTSADGSPENINSQKVDILKGESVFRSIMLSPTGAPGLGRYHADVRDLPEGDYEIRLRALDGAETLTMPLHIIRSIEAEMADINSNPQLLHKLASASGGVYLPLAQIATLPGLIERSQASQNHLIEKPLWDSQYLFLFVLACFAMEWAIRKRVGMV